MKLLITLAPIAGLCALFAAAAGGARAPQVPESLAAPAPQSGSGGSSGHTLPMREEFRSQDNVCGLELIGCAGGGQRTFELRPFVPPALYAGDFRGQASPVRVCLREELAGTLRDIPFSPAGSSWSLAIPAAQLGSAPGARYSVLAWESGPGLGDADLAVFRYGVEF